MSLDAIFVFGSNLKGIHGKGAALFAKHYFNAEPGVGIGRTGKAYAIPTKSSPYITLPLERIKVYVDDFLTYARINTNLTFQVTKIGCGLAGYKEEQIAPMFAEAPQNCFLPEGWRK